MTEPDVSGSDLLSIQTTARRSDRGWVLNGTKCMTGVGTEASVFFVFARTEMPGQGDGISLFAVPRGEGVLVGPNINKLGFQRTRIQELSMGMTHDFEIAIEEGAILVRVGEAIFGARQRRP